MKCDFKIMSHKEIVIVIVSDMHQIALYLLLTGIKM